MPDPDLIDHDTPYLRVWGVSVAGHRYRADCAVMAQANIEPPTWVTFGLRPATDGIALEDWARVGMTRGLGTMACEVATVTLTEIDDDAWALLAGVPA